MTDTLEAPVTTEPESQPQMNPRVRGYDLVTVHEIDPDYDYFSGTLPVTGYVNRAEYRAGNPVVSVPNGHGYSQNVLATRWEIKQQRQTPRVKEGDIIRILAAPSIYEYADRFDLDAEYPVLDASGDHITVTLEGESGNHTNFSVYSWELLRTPPPPSRPTVAIGAKVRVLEAYPARKSEDGTFGNGVGIVTRHSKAKMPNGRIRAVFTSDKGVQEEHVLHSWEVIPFDSTEEELACFKDALWRMAMHYGKEHDMCATLTTALQEAGVIKENIVEVTFKVNLHDGGDARDFFTPETLTPRALAGMLSRNPDVAKDFSVKPVDDSATSQEESAS